MFFSPQDVYNTLVTHQLQIPIFFPLYVYIWCKTLSSRHFFLISVAFIFERFLIFSQEIDAIFLSLYFLSLGSQKCLYHWNWLVKVSNSISVKFILHDTNTSLESWIEFNSVSFVSCKRILRCGVPLIDILLYLLIISFVAHWSVSDGHRLLYISMIQTINWH